MRRASWAIAVVSGCIAGCGGGTQPAGRDSGAGVVGASFTIVVQNGQSIGGLPPNPVLAIEGGRIVSDPPGIDCGVGGSGACSADFPADAQVFLDAIPADALDPDYGAPYLFVGWSGDCSGHYCRLTGPADRYVVASFAGKRTWHPNYTDPAEHGPATASRGLDCTECHGENLRGVGTAIDCQRCHEAAFVAGVRDILRSPPVYREHCASCHASGSLATAAKHAGPAGVVRATAGAVTPVGADLQLTVSVTTDGAPDDGLTAAATVYRHAANAARAGDAVANALERFPVANAVTTPTGAGAYRVVIPGGVALVGSVPTTFLVQLASAAAPSPATRYATAVASYNGPARDLVGDAACRRCHGDFVFRRRGADGDLHHGSNPEGVAACVVCHVRYDAAARGMGGDQLAAYVHGIHGARSMGARQLTRTVDGATYTVTKPAGVYARNDAIEIDPWAGARPAAPYSATYPGDMLSCSTCHDSEARLAAVMAKRVNASICFTCHDGWSGFFRGLPRTSDLVFVHETVRPVPADPTVPAPSDCHWCHDGSPTRFGDVSGRHRARTSARQTLFYGGKDASLALGERLALSIDEVSYDGASPPRLVVRWSARLDGAPVDPCNASVDAGPVFFGLHTSTSYGPPYVPANVSTADVQRGVVESNLRILQAHALGNDWVNEPDVSGQPRAAAKLQGVDPSADAYTTCAGPVATSVLRVPDGVTATRGAVALQGRPQLLFTDASSGYARVIEARVETPVREYVVASGAEPPSSERRRRVVATEKCLACHDGGLFQHAAVTPRPIVDASRRGGTGVDSVELCAVCHGPAASDAAVRRFELNLDFTTTYDGVPAQPLDLRYLVHAIHAAGESDMPLAYYGADTVFLAGSPKAVDLARTYYRWPGETDGYVAVWGAAPGRASLHREIVVKYPRPLQDCGACHVDGSENALPDQRRKMAVTTDVFSPELGQAGHALLGAQAASCASCHQVLRPWDEAYRAWWHVFDWGWMPDTFPEGRRSIIEVAP